MDIKERDKSNELQILGYLSKRMDLSEKEEKYYKSLEQGYQGECLFDNWLEGFKGECIVLNDLLPEQNNTLFQIDSLIITHQTIYLFEVKNFHGDFCLDGDRWYTRSGSEIKNPLLQMKRSETLLRQILQQMQLDLSIESHLVFINPHFYLYNCPPELPIIFSPQLKNFFQKLKLITHRSRKRTNEKLASHLIAEHINDYPYHRVPRYSFSQLRKGIICTNCNEFFSLKNRKMLACNYCSYQEGVDKGVLRNIKEYKRLFPDKKITTSDISEWCDVVSKRTIRRILSSNYVQVGDGRSVYYVAHEKVTR